MNNILDDEEKKKQDLSNIVQQNILGRIQQPQQDSQEVMDAKAGAERTNLIANIGAALSTAGNAQNVGRGGAPVDLSFYDKMRQSVSDKVRQAVEGDRYRAESKDKAVGALAGIDQFNKGQAFQDKKLTSDQDQFKKELGFKNTQLNTESGLKSRQLSQDMNQFGRKLDHEKDLQQNEIGFKNDKLDAEMEAATNKEKLTQDKELQKVLVPRYNAPARTEKEAVEFRAEIADTENARALEQVKELGKGITLGDRTNVGIIDSLLTQAVGKLRLSFVGPGPMTDTEAARVRNSLGDPTTLFSTEGIQSGRLQQVLDNMEAALDRKASGVIIGYQSKGDKEALDWAKKNPKDPRSKEILTRLGQ